MIVASCAIGLARGAHAKAEASLLRILLFGERRRRRQKLLERCQLLVGACLAFGGEVRSLARFDERDPGVLGLSCGGLASFGRRARAAFCRLGIGFGGEGARPLSPRSQA